ncbi:unnamed protein product [Didymodactylos carnosus]|uniref:K Homology domain-containing protein n=2 Tax=Didymodactylos carnosus TaxID=1234261 RepID=A0A8S2ENC6_9BILA|nr:unnamed protein product [Didymodactylos carnosus]CAF4002908.1 unnamed protein product [Didymodactylos carnosus]
MNISKRTQLEKKCQLEQQVASIKFDLIYKTIYDQLKEWKLLMIEKLNSIHDKTVDELDISYTQLKNFKIIIDKLLTKQISELQNSSNLSREKMNEIKTKLNPLLNEIEQFEHLSLRLNDEQIQISGKLNLLKISLPSIAHNEQTSPVDTSIEQNLSCKTIKQKYRLLISINHASKLEQLSKLSSVHLSPLIDKVPERILTIDVEKLVLFLNIFDQITSLLNEGNEIRVLIHHQCAPYVIGKLGQTSKTLQKRYKLETIQVFSECCPESDERVLVLRGPYENIKNCLEEIYYNIEQSTIEIKTMKLYDPKMNDENCLTDYGGYIDIKKNIQRAHLKTSIMNKNIQQITFSNGNQNNGDEDVTFLNENDERRLYFHDYDYKRGNFVSKITTVSDKQAGILIGVRAMRIQSICQQSGAKVYVGGEFSDSERPVFVKGNSKQVAHAVELIDKLIKRQYKRLPVQAHRCYGKGTRLIEDLVR